MQKLKRHSPSQTALGLSQHSLAVALKFAVIAIVIVVIYSQDLGLVFSGALNDESSFHILAIPFLFLYLMYRKRKMISATLHQPDENGHGFKKHLCTVIGVSLFATSILTYWYGSYTFTPLEYHMVTLPFVAASLILIMFNPQTLRQAIFPVAFLIFLMPPPAEILYTVGSALSNLTAVISNSLVNLFGVQTVLTDTYGSPLIILTRPDNTVMNFNVSVACSGIYSLIGFTIFALFIAYITRGKLRNKLFILISGIPLILALNVLRITAILGLGYAYGDELALEVFHAVGATVLMFIGTLILLAVTEKVFKKPQPLPLCPTCSQNDAVPRDFCPTCGKLFRFPKITLSRNDLAKIFALFAVVAVLVSIQAPVFALTQGPAQIDVQTPSGIQGNTLILPTMQNYTLTYLYRDTAFEELSGEDASLVYAYGPNNQSSPVWVAVELATSLAPLHRWETCLVNFPISQGNQPKVTTLDLRDVKTQDNPPIVARYFAFQYPSTNQTQVVLYWYQTAKFNVNGTTQTMNVKMSLVDYPASAADVPEAETRLLAFALAINAYWQPIQLWTTIALIISQNGLILSAIAGTILVAAIVYWFFLDRHTKHLLLQMYGKLSAQDKLLLTAVANAQKAQNASTQGVTVEFQKLTGAMNEFWVKQKLQEAQNAGIVKSALVSVQDSPTVRWQLQIPRQ
jgi:exosortase